MDKENFLNILKNLSPAQLNELIEQKGKKRKLIKPIVRLKKYDDNN